MNNLIDKVLIFIICLATYMSNINDRYMVVPILVVIGLSAILSYIENHNVVILEFIIFLCLCFLNPAFLFFIPLICYDLFIYKIKWLWSLTFLPLCIDLYFLSNWIIIAYILVAFLLKYRTISFENMKKTYYTSRDNAKELSIQFEQKNRDLLEKQDYEINLATLSERNRIARDIHDNVGHLLSRCILQIGALLVINKNETVNESLVLINNTLAEAMNSIRNSVHDLHEESIDLQVEIQQLIDTFEFCSIKLHCDMESSPNKNVKYAFISITKEALSNVIKHSNATEVTVSLREHPALYQLVINDNGSNINYTIESGIGIKNINDRVSSLGGNINITANGGFRIFISIPKIC